MSAIVLVGMPGAGKSTVGVLLAKELAMDFLDTDLLIQSETGKALQEIVDSRGYEQLREIEESVILRQKFAKVVVATGGSAVYGQASMRKLKESGKVVYLSCQINELRDRIGNFERRGIAASPNQSFAEITAEREVLYRQYADIEVSTDGLKPLQVVEKLIQTLV